MSNTDAIAAAAHIELDREEAERHMCAVCRDAAQPPDGACHVCGVLLGEMNPAFDEARFRQLKGGGGSDQLSKDFAGHRGK